MLCVGRRPEKGGNLSAARAPTCLLLGDVVVRGARARVGLGWGLFLWNYLNGQGRAPTVADVAPNAKILAAQAGVAGVDYFVWTRFFGLHGSALYVVMLIFDVRRPGVPPPRRRHRRGVRRSARSSPRPRSCATS